MLEFKLDNCIVINTDRDYVNLTREFQPFNKILLFNVELTQTLDSTLIQDKNNWSQSSDTP